MHVHLLSYLSSPYFCNIERRNEIFLKEMSGGDSWGCMRELTRISFFFFCSVLEVFCANVPTQRNRICSFLYFSLVLDQNNVSGVFIFF